MSRSFPVQKPKRLSGRIPSAKYGGWEKAIGWEWWWCSQKAWLTCEDGMAKDEVVDVLGRSCYAVGFQCWSSTSICRWVRE